MKRKTNPWWKEELGINTQKEVTEKIRNIVKSYPPYIPINYSDTNFLVKVLQHHHHFKQKMGVGLKHLEIRVNPSWNGPTNGIWIIRTDDTETDISWVTALKPEGKPSVKEDVSNAARYEISPQIHDFHENGKCAVCELCNKEMTRGEGLHVDHINPFEKLFLEFVNSLGITYDSIITKDLGLESQFLDRDLSSKWITFHQEKATLRLLHKKCNLERK